MNITTAAAIRAFCIMGSVLGLVLGLGCIFLSAHVFVMDGNEAASFTLAMGGAALMYAGLACLDGALDR